MTFLHPYPCSCGSWGEFCMGEGHGYNISMSNITIHFFQKQWLHNLRIFVVKTSLLVWFIYIIRKNLDGAGTIIQWSIAHIVCFPELTWKLTTISNSSSKELDILYWPPRTLYIHMVHRHIWMQNIHT